MAVRHQGKLNAYAQTEEEGQEEIKQRKEGSRGEGRRGRQRGKRRISGQDRRDKAEWKGQDRDAYRIRLLFELTAAHLDDVKSRASACSHGVVISLQRRWLGVIGDISMVVRTLSVFW